MAETNHAFRMKDNATRYPFTRVPGAPQGEYDVRVLPVGIKDPEQNRPLVPIGTKDEMYHWDVPVIFLRTTRLDGEVIGRKFETKWVKNHLMRMRLQPGKLAVYATPEWYRRLGLPVRDHRINEQVANGQEEVKKLALKQLWAEEPWRFTTFMRFRKYRDGPPELLDDETPWDGTEEMEPRIKGAAGKGPAAAAGRGTNRKAKKVKLF
jgi:hypothetical protein